MFEVYVQILGNVVVNYLLLYGLRDQLCNNNQRVIFERFNFSGCRISILFYGPFSHFMNIITIFLLTSKENFVPSLKRDIDKNYILFRNINLNLRREIFKIDNSIVV